MIEPCNSSKPSDSNSCQTASRSGGCAASLARVALSTTRHWRCRRSATSKARRSWVMLGFASCSLNGATAKDLERAYSNFFAKRADFPRFKKKGRSDSFRYPDPKQIKLDQGNSRIFFQARLAALSQQPESAGRSAQRHRQPERRQVVRFHSDRASGRAGHPAGWRGRHRHGHCPVRYALGRLVLRTHQQLQAA